LFHISGGAYVLKSKENESICTNGKKGLLSKDEKGGERGFARTWMTGLITGERSIPDRFRVLGGKNESGGRATAPRPILWGS